MQNERIVSINNKLTIILFHTAEQAPVQDFDTTY